MNQIQPVRSSRLMQLGVFIAVSVVVVSTVVQTRLRAESGMLQSPSKSLAALNLKFAGSSSCGNASCHGGTAADAGAPAKAGSEFTVWSTADRHHDAFKTLKSNPKSKAIASGLDIADPSTSGQCLSCHALDVPATLHAASFKVTEGVSCEACHGPSEKWLAPHSHAGWIQTQRTATGNDHQKLLSQFGIYDAKNSMVARADRCTSCHLAIDAKLVAKGHPQPTFEIAFFSESEPKHWRDPDGVFVTRLWATGQAVCLRDAATQLADRLTGAAPAAQVKEAVSQTTTHYTMVRDALLAADPATAAKLTTAFEKLTAPTAADAVAVSQLAATIADQFDKLAWTPAQTAAILKAVTNENPTDPIARVQQAEGAYELFNAYTAAAGTKDDAGADAFAALVPADPPGPGGPVDAKYGDNLKAARSHLPK